MAFIYDSHGKTKATTVVQGSITRMFDKNNRYVGSYDSSTNYTVDAHGSVILRDNQLMSFLPQD